jgi:hypothetical protein
MTINEVAKWVKDRPDAYDDVHKAAVAFHTERWEPGAHYFSSSLRQSKCFWCGRSREQVRYDDLPPECAKHEEPSDIAAIILKGEFAAIKLLDSAESFIPRFFEENTITGESLAVLHHTHGFDFETICGVEPKAELMHADYELFMNAERARSRAAQKKAEIVIE